MGLRHCEETYRWLGEYNPSIFLILRYKTSEKKKSACAIYLRRNKRITLSSLQISGKLNDYLANIDRQSEGLFERLVKQMAAAEGVTELSKTADQMAWVGKMNSIQNLANEIVNNELIFM